MAVLAFHLGYERARGGYLGVAVFFTLSGFLITSIVTREQERSATVDLARFWSRRARRLLPLAVLGVVGASVVAAVGGPDEGTQVDLVAALVGMANWRFVLSGSTYGDLFSAPSPVLHYWSLSIEAQFYAVFPIVGMLALRRSSRALTMWLIGACALSFGLLALAVAAGWSEMAYYSTPTRVGEIAVGSLLALGHRRWQSSAGANQASRRSRGAALAGAAAAAFLLWSFASVGIAEDDSHLLLLPAVALATAVVIRCSLHPGSLASVLSWRPLCYVGSLSYALYVVHWPVFIWLSAPRVGLDPAPLTVLRLAVTALVAVVAHHLIELPFMRAAPAPGRVEVRLVSVALVAAAGVSFSLVSLVDAPPRMEDLAEEFARPGPSSPGSVTPEGASVRPRVVVFGDSTALVMGLGLREWAEQEATMDVVDGVATLGCGLEPPGARRRGSGAPSEDRTEQCGRAVASWPTVIAESGASVAVIQVGPWDTADRRPPGSDRWQHLGMAVYDEVVLELIAETVDQLQAAGAEHVIWLTAPPIRTVHGSMKGTVKVPEGDPARMARLNDLAARVAETRPGMHLLDLAGHLEGLGSQEDERLRPDGVHFSQAAALEVARWVGPEILRIAGGPAQRHP